MRTKWMLIICVVLTFFFSGCSGRNEREILNIALENIKSPLQLMDQRYAIYTNALAAMERYIQQPTEDSLSETKTVCARAIGEIASLPTAESALSDDEKASMVKIGINVADYSVPIENEAYNKYDCIKNLTIFAYYLYEEPKRDEVLRERLRLFAEVNEVFRKVDYLCLNELFCKFSGEEIDAFANEFLPTLSTLSMDQLPWETDSAVLVARANKLMNDAEGNVNLYAEFIGSQYKEFLNTQANYGNILTEAGYSEQDAEKIIAEIDAIYEESLKSPDR